MTPASVSPSHKMAQQLHANRRARERLGVHFNRHMAHEIILEIKAGKNKAVGRGPGPATWHQTEIEGIPAWVCYNRLSDRIVTILDVEPVQVTRYRERGEALRREQSARDKAKAIAENQSERDKARVRIQREQKQARARLQREQRQAKALARKQSELDRERMARFQAMPPEEQARHREERGARRQAGMLDHMYYYLSLPMEGA